MRDTFALAALVLFLSFTAVRADDAVDCAGAAGGAAAKSHDSADPFDQASGRDVRNYPPDPQVDFQHIKLDLRMPDPMSRSFTCTETITVRTTQRPIDRLTLNAVNLDIK